MQTFDKLKIVVNSKSYFDGQIFANVRKLLYLCSMKS